ncbi:hypothetical protein V6N13_030689 [Hibiscus sabdariffa]
MARNRVKFPYITNHAARKAIYNKRKKGLVKEVSELPILCGVEACVYLLYCLRLSTGGLALGCHSPPHALRLQDDACRRAKQYDDEPR